MTFLYFGLICYHHSHYGLFFTTSQPILYALLLLLLLLSCFSRVQLCVTPEMAAHQAPPSLGFSRQEHWSGLPFPSPMHESEKWKWSRSVCPIPSDPMDCSPPGSSVHGIFQARVLEWGAIAFSHNNLCTPNYYSQSTLTSCSGHQKEWDWKW